MSNARQIADVAPTLGRKNLLINGSFDVWQRPPPFTVSSANIYTADRWLAAAASANLTISKGTLNSAPYLYIVGASGNTYAWIAQRVEAANACRTVGKSVAISGNLYNNGASAVPLTLTLFRANSADSFGSKTSLGQRSLSIPATGYLNIAEVFSSLPAEAGYGLEVFLSFPSGIPASTTIGIYRVQLEIGSEVTDHEYRSYAEELAMCQRYYEVGYSYGIMAVYASTSAYSQRRSFAVTKRASPTVTVTNYQAWLSSSWASWPGTITPQSTPDGILLNLTGATGLTVRCNPEQYSWVADAEL